MKKRLLSLLLCGAMCMGSLLSVGAEEGELDKLDVFINMSWYEVDSFTGINPDSIKEATGVDLDVTIATDSSQLGVMIASGDIPDLVFTDTELDRLSNANVCYSYNELEEQYGANFDEKSEEFKNIARSFSSDENYYTMLNAYSTNEEFANLKVGALGTTAIFYRKDLVEQLGNPEMNTIEDLMNVLEQCKEAFPDMVPMGLGGIHKFDWMRTWMGANYYNTETGEYTYGATDPAYKDFMKMANTFARNGYVTAEAYANELETNSHADAYNSGCVFYVWYCSSDSLATLNKETVKSDPNAEWALLPRLSDEENIGTTYGWAGAFVSRNCSNPEAAARLLTYLHSEEGRAASIWGREGVDYTLDEDGVPQFSEEFKQIRSEGRVNEVYNFRFNFGTTATDEIYLLNSGLDEEYLSAMSTFGANYVNYPEVAMAKPTSSSDEGVIYAKLEEIRKSYDAKVIFAASDEEFESSFQEYVDTLTKAGVETYNEYMTQAILEAKEVLGK